MKSTYQLHRVLVLAGCLSLLMPASLGASDEPLTPGFALLGIQSGLRRSPELWVAAVLEVVRVQQCSDSDHGPTCPADALLVAVLASRGGEFKAGSRVAFMGARNAGSRYLAFLVPVEGFSGVYGATFLSPAASDEDRNTFVADLRKAGL